MVLLLAILGATAGWRALRTEEVAEAPAPTSTTTPPTTATDDPETWPIEIQPLAEFVEEHRGGPFDHPVPIQYLEEADYEAAISAASAKETEQDKADTETWTAQLQALGLLAPDVDVDAALDQLQGEGTLAFYDDDSDEIKVLGSNFDVAHRVTLVHELTHAWQDQHGYLEAMDDLDDTLAYTLRSMAEGDATRIENEYVDSLSSKETDQYAEQSREQAAQADLTGIPDVLLASLQSAYALGGPFVSILDSTGGNDEVDTALADPPPAEADLFEPTRFLDGVQPVDVAEPAVPFGAERLDGGEFGALTWLFTLSQRIDPRDALDLVDRWAGDSYVTYRLDGRVCNAAAYRGEQPDDARCRRGPDERLGGRVSRSRRLGRDARWRCRAAQLRTGGGHDTCADRRSEQPRSELRRPPSRSLRSVPGVRRRCRAVRLLRRLHRRSPHARADGRGCRQRPQDRQTAGRRGGCRLQLSRRRDGQAGRVSASACTAASTMPPRNS